MENCKVVRGEVCLDGNWYFSSALATFSGEIVQVQCDAKRAGAVQVYADDQFICEATVGVFKAVAAYSNKTSN